MQVSFRRTLVAYTLIVVILATVGTSFYCIQESRKQSIHVFDEGCKAACRIAGMAAAGALDRGDFETAHGQLKQLVRHDTSIIGAGVFSASGDPVVPYVGASRFGRRLTDPGAYSRTKNEFQSRYAAEQLRVTGPLVNSRGELLGFLSVDYALHQAYSVQHAITVKSIELTATFVFFSAVLAIALSWKVTRPIIAITEAAREISRRKFEVRVKSTRQQELNTLVTTINAMAEELEQTTVSKEYVSGIIDSMHDGLLVARRDGVVEMVNPAMCRLTDNESEDLVGQSIGSVLQTLAGDPYDAIDLLIDQVPEGVDAYLVNRDGGRTAVSVSSAAIGPDCGIHARYVVVMKDITVRKETELALDAAIKEAQLASRVKSEFLANMSHELRTPMNSIIGFTKRLITKLGDSLDERHLDALNTVDRNAKHLLGLINDILDLSKIEAGRMDLKRDSFDFAAAIREVVHQTDTLADGTAIRFVSEIPDEPIGIEADRIKVVQIATNLISNAIKYTNEGEVRVRVVEDIDRDGRPVAVLEVQDTGVGIKPDDLQRLFQKFSQLNSGSSRPVGGTGLGLYITASYIEMHGGRIKVASEYGAGSVFTAILPLVAAEP
ncbi:MAG: ATP-binding protein, partial [Pirellulaceae bacterium]|nr:ATP-binding protein [Pirellulaceae bacterium]